MPAGPGKKTYTMDNEGRFVEAAETAPTIQEVRPVTAEECTLLVNKLLADGWTEVSTDTTPGIITFKPDLGSQKALSAVYSKGSAVPPDFIKIYMPEEK